MAVHSDTFRHALGRFGSGVTVVTMSDGGVKTGLTVSAFCSLSLEPPLILVCIDKRSSSLDVIGRVKKFAVNILASDQTAVSNQCASKVEDKFSGIPNHQGQLDVPILDGCLGHLECSLVNQVDAGDHIICVGQVEAAEIQEDKEPLLYYAGRYRSLGESL